MERYIEAADRQEFTLGLTGLVVGVVGLALFTAGAYIPSEPVFAFGLALTVIGASGAAYAVGRIAEIANAPDVEDDEWDPEPASLRDGETPDETSHAKRNELHKEQLREELDERDA